MLLGIIRTIYKPVRFTSRLLGSLIAKTYLKSWGVEGGEALVVHSLPVCRRHPKATIEFGKNVKILNNLSENPAGISHPTVIVAETAEAHVKIGNNVRISGAVIYCTKEIVIEDYVYIGAGARIYDTDFHPLQAAERRVRKEEAIGKGPVHICEDVWVGAEAVILKGVTIGARSVVGTRAVVTKDVPPDVIVAGIPAKIIRSIPGCQKGR